jgi:DNA-binding NarL/FixJ family response regulator
MICVGIVEHDPYHREAIAAACRERPDIRCVYAVDSPQSLLSPSASFPSADVLLMGVRAPWTQAVPAIRELRERFSATGVVVISDDEDFHCIFDLLCAGASGYLLRGTSATGLCDAVRQAAQGGAPMSPPIARKVIEFFHHRGADPTRALTPREREIVSGLVDGLSYKQIASRMHITVETVRSHIKSTYHKLHVHGKAELIARTLRGEL